MIQSIDPESLDRMIENRNPSGNHINGYRRITYSKKVKMKNEKLKSNMLESFRLSWNVIFQPTSSYPTD